MNENKADQVRRLADNARIETLRMLATLGNGHVGGSLSVCDALAVLYSGRLKHDPQNPQWEGRDYLVLSKGHAGPALYATLALRGFFPLETLQTLNRVGTILPSHCDRLKTPGIDMTTGSLGQGISAALGMALGLKAQQKPNRVYAIIGDGEMQEGQVWEVLLAAPNKGADNLIVLVDDNGQQVCDFTRNINDIGDPAVKAAAFGWHTETCDGHDPAAIDAAIQACLDAKMPGFIRLKTVKGKGWAAMEGVVANHAMKGLTAQIVAEPIAQLTAALEEKEEA